MVYGVSLVVTNLRPSGTSAVRWYAGVEVYKGQFQGGSGGGRGAERMGFVSGPPRGPSELLETSDRPEAQVQHPTARSLAKRASGVTGRGLGAVPPRGSFDKNGPSEARRVVVMRDARRGRPRASADATEPADRPPRTSDPPQ